MRRPADRPTNRRYLSRRRKRKRKARRRGRYGTGFRPLGLHAQQRVEDNTWLAYRMAWRFVRRHARDVPADELIAEALLGLTYAAGRFRESYGVPFGAYATMVIRHWLIQAVQRWRKGTRFGQLPTVTNSHGEEVTWEAEARPAPDPCVGLAAREMCARVRRAMPARLYRVLRLRHGEGRTLSEVADRLGVSRQRAQQMLAMAEQRARTAFPEWVGN